MKQKLIAFAEYFYQNSREIKGLSGRFCLTSALREYSAFYKLHLFGLALFNDVPSERIDDPVGARAGYIISNKAFNHLDIT